MMGLPLERLAEFRELVHIYLAPGLTDPMENYRRQRLVAEAFETLAEIGREVAAVLDLDELLSRLAQLARRVVDYRTFGILLLNEPARELEIKVAVQ
jgi:hypothetical protein